MGVFDPDFEAAAALAEPFENAGATATYDELLGQRPDFVVIASPPRYHAEQAIAALRQGIAVHCEKPLATSLEEGKEMVAEADRMQVPLSIGMVRRRLAPARMIKALLERNAIGALETIEIFEGGPFQWPVASPAYFDRSQGGVGPLEDIGTHVIDLLTWWLGSPTGVAYTDDAMGGVAANCLAALTYRETVATVRLSRDWHRPNEWVLRGSSGWMRWSLDDWEGLELSTGDGLTTRMDDDEAVTFEQAFALQLADFGQSLDGGEACYVAGADALPVLETLERCKAVRTRMDMPWLK